MLETSSSDIHSEHGALQSRYQALETMESVAIANLENASAVRTTLEKQASENTLTLNDARTEIEILESSRASAREEHCILLEKFHPLEAAEVVSCANFQEAAAVAEMLEAKFNTLEAAEATSSAKLREAARSAETWEKQAEEHTHLLGAAEEKKVQALTAAESLETQAEAHVELLMATETKLQHLQSSAEAAQFEHRSVEAKLHARGDAENATILKLQEAAAIMAETMQKSALEHADALVVLEAKLEAVEATRAIAEDAEHVASRQLRHSETAVSVLENEHETSLTEITSLSHALGDVKVLASRTSSAEAALQSSEAQAKWYEEELQAERECMLVDDQRVIQQRKECNDLRTQLTDAQSKISYLEKQLRCMKVSTGYQPTGQSMPKQEPLCTHQYNGMNRFNPTGTGGINMMEGVDSSWADGSQSDVSKFGAAYRPGTSGGSPAARLHRKMPRPDGNLGLTSSSSTGKLIVNQTLADAAPCEPTARRHITVAWAESRPSSFTGTNFT